MIYRALFTLFLLAIAFSMVALYFYREISLNKARLAAPEFGEIISDQGTENPRTQGSLFQNNLPLDKPHRTYSEIEEWIGMSVSEALSINPENFQNTLRDLQPDFTEDALQQYRSHLSQSGIFKALAENNLKTSVLIELPPALLNEGVLDNIYRWLYEVPVTVTFLPAGTTSYEGFDPVNRKLLVRLQVRRVPLEQDNNLDLLRIDQWNVTPRR